MKTLLLLRHAKSSWKDTDIDDHERPLNKRGKNDAPRIGRLIRDEGLTPDLIIASSAKRCRKTAECIIHDSSYRGETRITAELYEADGQRLKAFVAGLDDKLNRVLLIAHNPGLEQLLEDLTGVYTPLTTCALAKIELPIDSWSKTLEATEPRATVPNVWQPRELAD